MRAFSKAGCFGVALGVSAIALAGIGGATAAPKASAARRTDNLNVPGAYGSLPRQAGPATTGGTLTIAENPGAGPSYIFPITPAANLSVFDVSQFQYYMWRPLWWSPNGDVPTIDYGQSIGQPPIFTNYNKTLTVHINPGWKWSDGAPVTSQDVAFDFWLTLAAVTISPANDGDFTPGLFPDGCTVTTPSPSTVVFRFTKSYNANFDLLDQLGAVEPLPSAAWSKTSETGATIPFDNLANAEAIYRFLNKQSMDLKSYGTNPLWQVVDGPYKISSFDPATDGATLVVNPAYTGPVKPHIAQLDLISFTSTSAEFDQLLSGNLDVGFVDFSDLPEARTLDSRGYYVWGYPDLGFEYIDYNFKDKTGDFDHIISQLYIRQALAHLQDEPALIRSRGVFDGAAGQAYDSVPVIPTTPFTPATVGTDPYPYSVPTAASILKAHGWDVVPNGTTTCAKPGTGANECGAGIPKGTPLSWDLIYTSSPPVIGTEDEVLASTAKQVGINIKLFSKTFNYIIGNLSDVSNPDNDKLWAMQDFGGFTDDIYPTTNELFNTTGSFNIGGFSSSAVDTAIHNSEYSLNNDAVKAELALVAKEQPGLFQPNPDLIYAWKDTVSGPPASFEEASQYQYAPEEWYFVK